MRWKKQLVMFLEVVVDGQLGQEGPIVRERREGSVLLKKVGLGWFHRRLIHSLVFSYFQFKI